MGHDEIKLVIRVFGFLCLVPFTVRCADSSPIPLLEGRTKPGDVHSSVFLHSEIRYLVGHSPFAAQGAVPAHPRLLRHELRTGPMARAPSPSLPRSALCPNAEATCDASNARDRPFRPFFFGLVLEPVGPLPLRHESGFEGRVRFLRSARHLGSKQIGRGKTSTRP